LLSACVIASAIRCWSLSDTKAMDVILLQVAKSQKLPTPRRAAAAEVATAA
jgi:hypothetical protein